LKAIENDNFDVASYLVGLKLMPKSLNIQDQNGKTAIFYGINLYKKI
jgi:hypothetical protein